MKVTTTKTTNTKTTNTKTLDTLDQLDLTSPLDTRLTVQEITKELQAHPQVYCPLLETWDKETKTYTREISVPAGTLMIGFKHKRPSINILAKGTMLLKSSLNEEGTLVTVPEDRTYTFVTGPETQKMGYAITDCVFLNIFSDVPTDCTYEELMNTLVYGDSQMLTQNEILKLAQEPGKGI